MIAPEGKIIIFPLTGLLVVGIITYQILDQTTIFINYLNVLTFLLLVFSMWFFRDPKRKIEADKSKMISPADGKIIEIVKIEDSELGKALKISIFLSVFNVHSQYVPTDARVLKKSYIPGKYMMAFNHKASDKNERTEVLFEDFTGNQYKVKQIAGFIARRILNYMLPNSEVDQGDRLGFIRFGSRVDIIVPSNNFNLSIEKGDKVKSKVSVIGNFIND